MNTSVERMGSNAKQFERLTDLSGVTPGISPPVNVAEALARPAVSDGELPFALLHQRLAAEYRLAEPNFVLVADVDAALSSLVSQISGPVVLFPPSAMTYTLGRDLTDREVVEVMRGAGRDGLLSLDAASDLPHDGVAVIASPGDPLGNLLTANDAVRLSRSCSWLIIDERFAEYAGQSLLNVASEFSNVIIVRSFQARLGESGAKAGWVAGSARARELLGAIATPLPSTIAEAALASFTGKSANRMLVTLVRDERSRLYRALRKLSYLQPLPSWGPFVAARVEVGDRVQLLTLLEARGIRVHAPSEPGLERYIRIGIGTRSSMEHLRRSMLEIAPEMLAGQLASGCGDPYCLALRGEELGQPEIGQIEERRQRTA